MKNRLLTTIIILAFCLLSASAGGIKAQASSAPLLSTGLIYDGAEHELVTGGQVDSGSAIYYRIGETGTFSSGIPKAKDAGEYAIYYYTSDGAVNSAVTSLGKAIIEKRALTLKATDAGKHIGDEDGPLGFEITSGELVEGETLSAITVTRSEGEEVGIYDITLSMAEGSNPNYSLTFENGIFMITDENTDIHKGPKHSGSHKSSKHKTTETEETTATYLGTTTVQPSVQTVLPSATQVNKVASAGIATDDVETLVDENETLVDENVTASDMVETQAVDEAGDQDEEPEDGSEASLISENPEENASKSGAASLKENLIKYWWLWILLLLVIVVGVAEIAGHLRRKK